MDIIAYGAASKEKRRAEELAAMLGADVKGGKENLQGRLDALMDSMDDVTRLADRVIVRDAVNLMKAEARLNTVVQAKKYGMDHMVFDDLLDLSGIDTLKSTGYTHNAVKGEIEAGENCVIELKEASVGNSVKKVLFVGESILETKSSDIIPQMNGWVSEEGSVDCSSYLIDERFAAWRAFDNGSSSWLTDSSTSGWVSFKFNEEKTVSSYSIKGSTVSVDLNRTPRSWTFEGWNGNAWEIIDERSDVSNWELGEVKFYEFENSKGFVEYRINVTQNNGGNLLRIDEIEMFVSISRDSILQPTISLDNGLSWLHFEDQKIKEINSEKQIDQIKVRLMLQEGSKLLNYGLIWT